MPRPVVIIPGYYGSELVDTAANFEEWLTDDSLLHPIAVLNALRLDTGDPARIVASGPLDHFSLLPFLHLGIYSKLRRFLRDQAGYADADLHPIGIDWRQSLTRLADDLDAKIQAIGAPSVDIVAHSHGGLVARAYLHAHGAARVHSLITIGTPHKGMFTTFRAIYDGFRFLTFPPDHLRRTARTFPSAYELLPYDPTDGLFTWNGQPADATAQNGWCETQEMRDMLAAASAVIHALPAQLPVDASFVYGTRLDTTAFAAASPTRLDFADRPEGDGTVPAKSARGDGLTSSGALRRYPIPFGVHSSLFADEYTFELVPQLLSGQPPAAWLAARWSQQPMYDIFSLNTLAAEFRDGSGDLIPNAQVTVTLDGGRPIPLQPEADLAYAVEVTMPGAGSRLHWVVEAKAPGVPAMRRSGNLVARNN